MRVKVCSFFLLFVLRVMRRKFNYQVQKVRGRQRIQPTALAQKGIVGPEAIITKLGLRLYPIAGFGQRQRHVDDKQHVVLHSSSLYTRFDDARRESSL